MMIRIFHINYKGLLHIDLRVGRSGLLIGRSKVDNRRVRISLLPKKGNVTGAQQGTPVISIEIRCKAPHYQLWHPSTI